MAGRNHDAAIKVIHPGDVGNRRSGSDVQQIGICAGCSQASNQTVLKHIRAAASIFADYNACRLVVTVTLAQCVVVPAKEAANLVGMVCGQSDSGFATEAIGSKVFSHYSFFLKFFRLCCYYTVQC